MRYDYQQQQAQDEQQYLEFANNNLDFYDLVKISCKKKHQELINIKTIFDKEENKCQ
jgi:hypothetical protein